MRSCKLWCSCVGDFRRRSVSGAIGTSYRRVDERSLRAPAESKISAAKAEADTSHRRLERTFSPVERYDADSKSARKSGRPSTPYAKRSIITGIVKEYQNDPVRKYELPLHQDHHTYSQRRQTFGANNNSHHTKQAFSSIEDSGG